MTNSKFNQLENYQDVKYDILNKRMEDIKEHSKTVENDTFANFNKAVQDIQTNLNMSLAGLEQHKYNKTFSEKGNARDLSNSLL